LNTLLALPLNKKQQLAINLLAEKRSNLKFFREHKSIYDLPSKSLAKGIWRSTHDRYHPDLVDTDSDESGDDDKRDKPRNTARGSSQQSRDQQSRDQQSRAQSRDQQSGGQQRRDQSRDQQSRDQQSGDQRSRDQQSRDQQSGDQRSRDQSRDQQSGGGSTSPPPPPPPLGGKLPLGWKSAKDGEGRTYYYTRAGGKNQVQDEFPGESRSSPPPPPPPPPLLDSCDARHTPAQRRRDESGSAASFSAEQLEDQIRRLRGMMPYCSGDKKAEAAGELALLEGKMHRKRARFH
jgi:hypothetical protein